MTVTYCTVKNVISILRLLDDNQIRLDPDDTSDPAQAEVEGWINEAEDYIDTQTNHAWRAVTVANEPHNVEPNWNGFGSREHAVTLRNRSIRTFSHASGDKIELWNGSAWKDIVDPANGCTEARDKDYWVDYVSGTIYLVQQSPYVGKATVRVTYRYGETTVPGDIKHATEKFAALRVMESDFYKIVLPQGQGIDPSHSLVIDKWERDIEKVIDRRRELKGILVV